jgi:hypothetical protein
MFERWKLKRAIRRNRELIRPGSIPKLRPDERTIYNSEDVQALGRYVTNLVESVKAYEELERFYSDRVFTESLEFDIPTPARNDEQMWTKDEKGHTQLTSKGRFELRKLIDAEKARRFDVTTLWILKFFLPVVASLVGIIGALTGLVAVSHKTPAPEKKPPVIELPTQVKAVQK